MKYILYCLITIILTGCTTTPSRLTGGDIRLWRNTPVWTLAKAVKRGDTVSVKRILAEGTVSINYREPTYGESLLHWAIWHNKADMVKFLLDQGADVNLRDYWSSESPILLSCKYPDISAEIVHILLEYGADPNDLPCENDSVFEGRMRTLNTPILEASQDDLEKTKILIEAGADPYYCWEPEDNALVQAATQNHFEIVEYLLVDCGMDPNKSFSITIHGDTLTLRNILGLTPWHRATEENLECLQRVYNYLDEYEKKNLK